MVGMEFAYPPGINESIDFSLLHELHDMNSEMSIHLTPETVDSTNIIWWCFSDMLVSW